MAIRYKHILKSEIMKSLINLSLCFLLVQASNAYTETPGTKKHFIMLTKMLNHPFFDLARQGCEHASKSSSEYECEYTGPSEPNEEEQVRMAEDLLSRGADGIAISPVNASSMARLIKRANTKNIPVVTWDNELLPKDRTLRKTYIGTDNYQIGVEMGKALLKLRPQGGSLALQTGSTSSFALNERIRGIRETIAGHYFTEVSGTPLYCNDQSTLAISQMEDLLTKEPKLNAFLPVGAWPQSVHKAYRRILEPLKERLASKELVVVSADTLAMQMELLRDGLSHAQIGQRPFDMGVKAMEALMKIVKGEVVADPILTNLDICYLETIESCLK